MRQVLFYCGLLCWAVALVYWWLSDIYLVLCFAALAISAFTLHFLQQKVMIMFGKKIAGSNNTLSPDDAIASAPNGYAKDNLPPQKAIIASDMQLEGNIIFSGEIDIYGTVQGNIHAEDGVINIMRTGSVEGNIISKELVVDGTVNGICESGAIDVLEHGVIQGALTYETLSVKKGGRIVGKAGITPPKGELVTLSAEAAIYTLNDGEIVHKEYLHIET
ncbi:bactofilin family protein [Martelella alba]|nr:polymer-forming cytoskeletal protein [Martelella alba]